jgi:hypothetical protein
MPDLIDDIRTMNAREDVKYILAHMAPDKDYKKLVIPFDNWNVVIFYSEDEDGKKRWEQSIRTPGRGNSKIGEANDVLPNRSSTPEPETSGADPGHAR